MSIRTFFPRGPAAASWWSLIATACTSLAAPQTEIQFLSGRGPADAIPWEFTVTAGRRAGEQATLPVPSHWEFHGFGTYNYGQEPVKGSERGLYRTRFSVPAEWNGRRIRIVFGAVMTDTHVKVNGEPAGSVHQGGFTQFSYDVTRLLKPGAENVLEVEVAKVSANPDTERAERGGDYWVFGGIYRPVWLEAAPAHAIAHVAIDAQADGRLTADVTLGTVPGLRRSDAPAPPERVDVQVLDAGGRPVGGVFTTRLPDGGAGRVRVAGRIEAPRPWTAETPELYSLRVDRVRGDEVVHTVTERFGFRTFEVRDGDGLYLNGRRILLKGVNRHSFRPATGRALTREDCHADVRLIRSMNMNAVRMSHYPPDKAFLEACDELGLYVLNELSGWQHAHDTNVGRLLVRELVERDVNHPSVVLWANGNEGGWNRDLDGEFALYDPQRRRVLHPWDPFGGIDTKHYTSFDDHAQRLRGRILVMPTEILHGMYDGGGGAGLEDYWRAIEQSPVGAGAFIWVLADEGIVRTDRGGRIDAFSTFGPDGIVGPHHEKEGSYYTVREVWSPVQVDRPALDGAFDGSLVVHNRYDFTNLSACRFDWQLVRFGDTTTTVAQGQAEPPSVAPGASGRLALRLPRDWRQADALLLRVRDPWEAELWTWSWAAPGLQERTQAVRVRPGGGPRIEQPVGRELRLVSPTATVSLDSGTGALVGIRRGERTLALSNGPRLTYARPAAGAAVEWLAARAAEQGGAFTRELPAPAAANIVEVELEAVRGIAFLGFKLEISPDGRNWKTVFEGTRRPGDGTRYEIPPQPVAAVRVSNLHRSDSQKPALRTFRIGRTPTRFPGEAGGTAAVTTGTGRFGENGVPSAWVEARGAHGLEQFRWTLAGDALVLDYAYSLEGEFAYHGITFDHPEPAMRSLRWLGEGPYRVWQNRLRGTTLGVHETLRQEQQPGQEWRYPEFEGYFAGIRWARLQTEAGPIGMEQPAPGVYLRVGTPRISHPQTMADFPAGNVSWLHAIPGMASKFKTPELSGPSAQPARASGRYEGRIVFRLE